MPRFIDATGYLQEMRATIGKPWFSAICDFAIQSNGIEPTVAEIATLWNYLSGATQYTSSVVQTSSLVPSAPPGQFSFLETLRNFEDFKKLSSDLSLSLTKQITLVFGRNGSGKSSVCNALRVIANSERPADPLHNVRQGRRNTAKFSYKFRSDMTARVWDESIGFGRELNQLKYFDSTVALRHISGDIRPEASVELTAFRLEIFDYARSYVNALSRYGQDLLSAEKRSIESDFSTLTNGLSAFVDLSTAPFAGWSVESSPAFRSWLSTQKRFGAAEELFLVDLEKTDQRLTAALSEEGQKAIRAQIGLLSQLQQFIDSTILNCQACELENLVAQEALLLTKRAAAEELSRTAFPEGSDHDKHFALIDAAANIIELDQAKVGASCPLCRQELNESATLLFKTYHGFLVSTLQKEITEISKYLSSGRIACAKMRSIVFPDFEMISELLPKGMITDIGACLSLVQGSVPEYNSPLSASDLSRFSEYQKLIDHQTVVRNVLAELAELSRKATDDRAGLEQEQTNGRLQIAVEKATRAVDGARAGFVSILAKADTYLTLRRHFESMETSSLLRAMSVKGKEAHNELVLSSFQEKLSAEYVRLCGMTMDELGVSLNTRGAQQDVIVTPVVGDSSIVRVLSEGEQKIHALATFFTELTLVPGQVVVLDDPVTSFDYNYISNFCERIRDLVVSEPQRQLVIFTHNWDFFVNLQTLLNKSGLTSRLSVQVLEDCATISEYSETWSELIQEIDAIFLDQNEPDIKRKQHLSGLLRRLIETLTNTFVFNGQRHQFKNKSLPISTFEAFTKLVPLTTIEATKLRDLYGNLSPPEHDDIRNFYTSKPKAQFRRWYDEILGIQVSIEARR